MLPVLVTMLLLQATPPQPPQQTQSPAPQPVPQGGSMYDGNNAQLVLPPDRARPAPSRTKPSGGAVSQGVESTTSQPASGGGR